MSLLCAYGSLFPPQNKNNKRVIVFLFHNSDFLRVSDFCFRRSHNSELYHTILTFLTLDFMHMQNLLKKSALRDLNSEITKKKSDLKDLNSEIREKVRIETFKLEYLREKVRIERFKLRNEREKVRFERFKL